MLLLLLVGYSYGLFSFLLKREKLCTVYFALPYFMFIWKLLSLMYLETGTFSPEISTQTSRIYSDRIFFALSVWFWTLAAMFTVLLDRKTSRYHRNFPRAGKRYSYFAFMHGVVLAYLYINAILSDNAITNPNIDRSNFDAISKLPFVGVLIGTLSCFFLFVDGYIFFSKEKKQRYPIVFFALSVLLQVLMGNKFAGIYQCVFFFFSPYFIIVLKRHKNIRRALKELLNRKVILIIVLILAGMVGVLYFGFRNWLSGGYFKSFGDFVFQRFFNLQSGALWGIFNYVKAQHIELFGSSAQLKKEIEGILSGASQFDIDTGLVRVMSLTASGIDIVRTVANQSRLSGWYLAVSVLSLGYIGSALYTVVLALIFAVICVGFTFAVDRADILMVALSVYEYMDFFDYFRIGNFTLLFRPVTMTVLFVMTIYIILCKTNRRFVLVRRDRKRLYGR